VGLRADMDTEARKKSFVSVRYQTPVARSYSLYQTLYSLAAQAPIVRRVNKQIRKYVRRITILALSLCSLSIFSSWMLIVYVL